VADADWPAPGPTTSTSAASASSTGADHELGLRRVHAERLRREQAHAILPAPHMHRRPRREERGAHHAARAADHPERAELSLVRVALARREPRPHHRRHQQQPCAAARASAPMPSSSSSMAPQWSGPSAVCSPGLCAMKVSV
jgi:hypothetical protein